VNPKLDESLFSRTGIEVPKFAAEQRDPAAGAIFFYGEGIPSSGIIGLSGPFMPFA
jgi:hypothetical protein